MKQVTVFDVTLFLCKGPTKLCLLNRQKQMTAHKSLTHSFQTYFSSTLQSLKALPAVFPQGYTHSCFSSFLLVFSCLPPTHSICQTISSLWIYTQCQEHLSHSLYCSAITGCHHSCSSDFSYFLLQLQHSAFSWLHSLTFTEGWNRLDSFKYVYFALVMQMQTPFNTAQFRNCITRKVYGCWLYLSSQPSHNINSQCCINYYHASNHRHMHTQMILQSRIKNQV